MNGNVISVQCSYIVVIKKNTNITLPDHVSINRVYKFMYHNFIFGSIQQIIDCFSKLFLVILTTQQIISDKPCLSSSNKAITTIA